jgi:hypothetical protein
MESENKTGKINLYYDPRALNNEKKVPLSKEEDTMDNWDSDKLHKVIAANQKKLKAHNLTKGVCN